MNSDKWVQAISSSSSPSSQSSWLATARQAINECPSVDVWTKYAELLMQNDIEQNSNSPASTNTPTIDAVLPILENGMEQVGLWLDSSHHFWAPYIAAVKIGRSKEAVIQAYFKRLSIPHLAIDDTYAELSTYVSENGDYEEIMIQASKLVGKTRRLLVERERWELTKPVPYEAYLGWELERFSANARFDFCVPLFNRILTRQPHCSSTLWARFIRHMWFYHPHQAWHTVERALLYFPDNANLWSLKLCIACAQNNRERVFDVVKDAKDAGVNVEKTPNMLNTYSAWLVNSAEHTPAAVRELRMLIEPIIFSPFVSLQQLAVLTEVLANTKEIEIARKAWRKRAVAASQDPEFWESWVTFELNLSRPERIQGLIKLWKVYTHHCRIEDHPFVRRNVHRTLVVNSNIIEAEKIELAGETTVWVTRIPSGWDETSIRNELQVFGPIADVRYPPNRGFCYVQFETYDAAYRAETVGVEGLHIQLSDRSFKVRHPQHNDNPTSKSHILPHKSKKRHHDLENTVFFTGMQDSSDVDKVKQLLQEFQDTKAEEEVLQNSLLRLKVIFALGSDAGRAQLSWNGIILPSGASLRVSYA